MDEIQKLRKELTRLEKEKKTIQGIWSGITVNNSWETLLVNAPSSIDAFNKLMILSVTNADQQIASLPSTMSFSEFKPSNERGAQLKTNIVQIVNEAVAAHTAGEKTMRNIANDMVKISEVIHNILDILDQTSPEKLVLEVPRNVEKINKIVHRTAQNSIILECHFEVIIKILSSITSTVGRSGFMLLEEVKQFWSSIFSFYDEIRKLIEYTLESSCNAFVNLVHLQAEAASKQRTFVLKSKRREEIYRASLSVVAYALSIRHLADAYNRYSSQIIMPQLIAIGRYPLVAHSEIELAKARKQFKDFNGRCKNEMHQTLKASKALNKRKSILELDFGLEVHLSDMASELDKILTPIANFRLGPNRKSSDRKDGKKDKKENLSLLERREGLFDRLRLSVAKRNHSAA